MSPKTRQKQYSIQFSLEIKTDNFGKKNTLINRLEEVREFLLKQKYPPALINDSLAKIKSINRPDILRTCDNKNTESSDIQYVTTFNQHNPEIFPEICTNESILRDSRLISIFTSKTFLKSKRQPPSLKIQTKAKLTNRQWQIPTVKNAKSLGVGSVNTLKKDRHAISMMRSTK